ncbi:MAG: hypothetical protein IPN84_16620 [Sphingomonadales bacterium]|nr:hypothetical protein [Sphingomonadales bacterium]
MIILRSLSFRLASTYAILFAASVSAMLSAFYWTNVYHPIQKVEELIQVEADELTDMLIVDGQDATLRRLERLARSSERPLFIAAYKNPQGVWTLFNIPAMPELPPADWVKIEADIYKSGLEEDRLALLKISRLRNGALLLTGRDIARHEDISEKTRYAAGWIIPLTLILSVIGGYLMSRAIGLAINEMAVCSEVIVERDMD